jgi:hypothetical protein
MWRPAGVRLSIAGALLLAAACVGGSDDDAGPTARDEPAAEVPWSRAAEVAGARRGEYRKVLTVSNRTVAQALMEEWVAFDLDAPFKDRSVAVHVDPETSRFADTASREHPTLRFVYTADGAYMWHPRLAARCGTGWAAMPPDQLSTASGIDVDADDLLVVEPVDIIRSAPDPGPPVATDARGSVYAVPVPGTTGLGMASGFLADHPEITERLAGEQRRAEVLVRRDGGPVEITVDQSNALVDMVRTDGQSDVAFTSATITWTLTPVDAVPTTVPPEVVHPGECNLSESGDVASAALP